MAQGSCFAWQASVLLVDASVHVGVSLSLSCCGAVTHSGMTLAPLGGQLVADEVMAALQPGAADSRGLDAAQWLAPYRPTRDIQAAAAALAADTAAGLNWASALKPAT